MATVTIENHTPTQRVVSDPRGGFSKNIGPRETVEFEVDEERLEAMTGQLVKLDNLHIDGVDAFTVNVQE